MANSLGRKAQIHFRAIAGNFVRSVITKVINSNSEDEITLQKHSLNNCKHFLLLIKITSRLQTT